MNTSAPSAVKDERGFTLMEMVIAVTLVAMMAVGLWAVFRISVSSWSRGTQFIDANQRQRSITDLVKKQMASIYGVIAPIDLKHGGAIYPLFAGAPSNVQFISLNSLRFQDNPGLTMVSYDVVRDPQGNLALVEREEPYVGLDPERETIFDRKDAQVVTLFDNLSSCVFEYFDPGTPQRPSQWVKEWNARDAGQMPTAISMTMIARDSRGGLLNRQMVVPILAKAWDPRLQFVNPFDDRRRQIMSREDAP
jgi:prepilin-type N-terminal cleavage/methylation domain-containing protein